MFALILSKYPLLRVFAHEVVSRKDWATCRSQKSYDLCLECLRLPQVKLL